MTDEEWAKWEEEMTRKIEQYTGVKCGPPSEELMKQINAFWDEREKQKKQSEK